MFNLSDPYYRSAPAQFTAEVTRALTGFDVVVDENARLPIEIHFEDRRIAVRPGLDFEQYQWGLVRARTRIMFGPYVVPEFYELPVAQLSNLPDLDVLQPPRAGFDIPSPREEGDMVTLDGF